MAGVYDYLTGEYVAYEEKELMILEKRLQNVGMIIGFNIKRFDMPVLAPYLFRPIEQFPVLDLLDVVEKVRGHRASLESLAAPTLKKHKSGSGADALVLFKENKLKELKSYCLDDVRLTKEIYEYGCQHGKVSFTSSWDYHTYEIPVDWQKETEEFLKKPAPSQTSFPSSLF